MHRQTDVSERYLLPARSFEPAYLALHRRGELQRRAEEAIASLRECRVCPRNCGVNRLADEKGICRTGRYARVSSYFPHHGEEDCLRGWNGSGTIFFSWCNLRCVFCQNSDLSHRGEGVEVSPEHLAGMMLSLQRMGCHNINLVTPEHVVPQVLEALVLAVEGGLRLPIVYNTSAYDGMESLHLLDGVVDIYMPDFKIWDPEKAHRYLKARDYPEVARKAIQEMHRQVGVLKFDENGLAKRGLLVRHLVMPGGVAGTEHILRFLAEQVAPDTYVNVMAQYHPAGMVSSERYPEIHRRITAQEYWHAVRLAEQLGLRLDERA
ncbi:MAG: radical SAM protein [Armatimonadota bacterium]|nr:MAG: radical SAM protein [Armatimonadota bacterium]